MEYYYKGKNFWLINGDCLMQVEETCLWML